MKKQTLDASTLACVKRDLHDAASNGYNFENWTDEEIAGDIIAYDDTFEDWTVKDLMPYVKEARKP